MAEAEKKKNRCMFGCILGSGVAAIVLIMVGLTTKAWWHEPSPKQVVSPIGNITTYRLRGLWHYDSDVITKYKYSEGIITVTNSSYLGDIKHESSDLPGWYDAVRALQVIGCLFAFFAFFVSLAWTTKHFKSNIQCPCYGKVALAAYVIAGIFVLLGIIILVGKTETEQIAWAPSVAGFGGAFCIMAASFIRWGQQEECNID